MSSDSSKPRKPSKPLARNFDEQCLARKFTSEDEDFSYRCQYRAGHKGKYKFTAPIKRRFA